MKLIFIILFLPYVVIAFDEESYISKKILRSEEFGILNRRIDNEVNTLASRLQEKEHELEILKDKMQRHIGSVSYDDGSYVFK